MAVMVTATRRHGVALGPHEPEVRPFPLRSQSSRSAPMAPAAVSPQRPETGMPVFTVAVMWFVPASTGRDARQSRIVFDVMVRAHPKKVS